MGNIKRTLLGTVLLISSGRDATQTQGNAGRQDVGLQHPHRTTPAMRINFLNAFYSKCIHPAPYTALTQFKLKNGSYVQQRSSAVHVLSKDIQLVVSEILPHVPIKHKRYPLKRLLVSGFSLAACS